MYICINIYITCFTFVSRLTKEKKPSFSHLSRLRPVIDRETFRKCSADTRRNHRYITYTSMAITYISNISMGETERKKRKKKRKKLVHE